MSTTEQPVVAIFPEKEELPALSLTLKEFGFVSAALVVATRDEESSKHLQGFFTRGETVPEKIARKWAQELEEREDMLLVQEVFDSLETTIISSDSYELMYNFEPGTRIDFVLKSGWALLFKTLIAVLNMGGGVSIEKL
jgi:hypothetical protein